MSDVKTSLETPASALSGTEMIRMVQGGVNVRGTPSQIKDYVGSASSSLIVNAQTGTSYTIVTADLSKLVTFSNSSAMAVTLPQAGASFPNGWFVHVQNRGSGIVTITPTTSTVDGNATLTLWPEQGALIASDGTNYYTQRGQSSAEKVFNVRDFGALGDGSTDDTTAIQNAINACNAAGGGVVYFPDGVYIVGGALQDTSGANAQLVLPVRLRSTDTFATIEFRGPYQPANNPRVTTVAESPLVTAGATIKSTLNAGTGALLGTYGGSAGVYNYVRFVSNGIRYRMHADPVLTCVDMRNVSHLDFRDSAIDAGAFKIRDMSVPTTSTSYALRLPGNGNGAYTSVNNAVIVGFYNGVEVGEHAHIDNAHIAGCARGMVFVASDHASYIARALVQWCVRTLVFTGGAHRTKFSELDIEHADAAPWTNVYDVDDASNFARGEIYWSVVLANTGQDFTFNVNGAQYVKRQRVGGHAYYQLTDGATISVPSSITDSFRVTLGGNRTLANPSNPYDGQLYNFRIAQDATGSRTLTFGSKYKFAGGAPTLSTAASAVDFVSCQYDVASDTLSCAITKALA